MAIQMIRNLSYFYVQLSVSTADVFHFSCLFTVIPLLLENAPFLMFLTATLPSQIRVIGSLLSNKEQPVVKVVVNKVLRSLQRLFLNQSDSIRREGNLLQGRQWSILMKAIDNGSPIDTVWPSCPSVTIFACSPARLANPEQRSTMPKWSTFSVHCESGKKGTRTEGQGAKSYCIWW